ncbi:RNA polymerase sigma factor [uncultured Muribaculum sp.]|uniref:RNA polymerase sigma factor n=1 Tax=uncultured Muribaculum sp. TaxID=1918613 RepID=UPI003465C279
MFSNTTPEGRNNILLHQRITRLEPFDRAIILLWLEDMTYEEIAAIVGISVKALSVRLTRIRQKLISLNSNS